VVVSFASINLVFSQFNLLSWFYCSSSVTCNFWFISPNSDFSHFLSDSSCFSLFFKY